MILIVTNKGDYTADFLIIELQKRGIDYFRFNTEDFPTKANISWGLANGNPTGFFDFGKRIIKFSDITSVWFRRPVVANIDKKIKLPSDREFAEIESKYFLEGLWKVLDCNWVSRPTSIYNAEYKIYQLSVANEIGFTVWPTLITNSPVDLEQFYEKHNDIIYKPIRMGKINSDDGKLKLIFTNKINVEHQRFFNSIKYAPGIFQKNVPKSLELRITVIGDKIFPVEIHSQNNIETLIDWRRIDSMELFHKQHDLPNEIISKCKQLLHKMDLKFGAIDMILTPEGEYVFLEINPNGQWAWIQQLCPEIPLRETMIDLLLG